MGSNVPAPVPPSGGGLGQQVFNTIGAAIVSGVNAVIGPIGAALWGGIIRWLDEIERQAVEAFRPQLLYLRNLPGQPAFVVQSIDGLLAPRHVVQLAAIVPLAFGALVGAALAPIQLAALYATYQAQRVLRLSRLDPSAVFEARKRGLSWSQPAADELAEQGYSDDRQAVLYSLSRVLLGPTEAQEAWRRTLLSTPDTQTLFRSLGYSEGDVSLLMELAWRLPDVSTILQSWLRGMIPDGEAQSLLGRLGFDQATASTLMAVARPVVDAGQVLQAANRGLVADSAAQTELSRSGLSGDQIGLLRELAYNPLDPTSILQLYLRGDLGEADALAALRRVGYREQDARAALSLAFLIPGPSDLVRFAVREVFSPEIVQRYRTDEDFPAEFATRARQVGLSEEWARAYWRAHWELPSISQGYEMLHRGVIEQADLETLLRTQDVMPYWRDKVLKVSFAPYTRVDIRRMFAQGVLSKEQVFRAYKDIGYDDEHARGLTEFTVAEKHAASRDLTRSELINAYRRGLLSRNEAAESVRAFGYDDDETELLLAIADYQQEQADTEDQIAIIHDRLIGNQITETDAIAQLGRLNVPGTHQQKLVTKWRLELQRAIRKPSQDDLEKFWKRGVINTDQYAQELLGLGYPKKYVDYYVRILQAVGEKAPKERKLTLADLRALRRGGTITMEQFRAELRELGYNAEDIERQVKLEQAYDAKQAAKKAKGTK